MHQILTGAITSEPIYELKTGFSLHAHLCAEHAAALRTRIGEMREPPLGLDKVPDPHLEAFFDEVLSAPTTLERLLGLYRKAAGSLVEGMERHVRLTNPLADYPSLRLCRFALLELRPMAEFGEECIRVLGGDRPDGTAAAWLEELDGHLGRAGGLDGSAPPSEKEVPRRHSSAPWRFDPVPRRDERFPDPYNMGVNAEAFLYDEAFPAQPKVLMMFYKRLREIDVPEMMASILAETPGRPWEYYRDMTRQLWDEARHAMMGEVGFSDLGIDWRSAMINFTWSLALNTQLGPLERHAVLYFIEQGLMGRAGKRFEWEVARESGNRLAALFQDYDWADEVLHARIGRDWYLSRFDDPKQAADYGDECWSKVLMDWERWRSEGLTRHRNWWPDVYRQACSRWGREPDPAVLGYRTTYQSIRADLKVIPAE